MALETMNNLKSVNGFNIVNMGKLKEKYPEKFSGESQQMDYKWFETEIRPKNFIYVRDDVNSLAFTIQNGPIKENGVNGCQVTDMIAVAKHIIEELNKKFPCDHNEMTISHLENALFHQDRRTKDRENRNVEGTSRK